MEYLTYYNLKTEPFSVMPINKFYYHSEQHDRALQKLQYAVENMKGLAVLVGEVGTGKTMLARRLLDSLSDEEYEASLLIVIHSEVDSGWLVKRIAAQLDVVDPTADKVTLIGKLYQRLVELSDAGKKVVVLIDEAQMLKKKELMEELRGLLNLELPDKKLISFVFFGLPELDNCLAEDLPLTQRIAVKHRLLPFQKETTADYVRHRIALAAGDPEIFEERSLELIHAYSHGVPRVINVICDNALFESYIKKHARVSPETIISVAGDLGFQLEV